MDQVLEHLLHPRKVFQEVKRVLKNGGYFCLGVPNAQEYANSYIFDFFWFLLQPIYSYSQPVNIRTVRIEKSLSL